MKTFKPNSKLFALIGFILSLSGNIYAETVIIISSDSGLTEISAKETKSIFLGKSKKLPNGKKATPVEQSGDSSSRKIFNKKILRKNEQKLKAYWSKKVFSGKGQPPKQVSGDGAVKTFVKKIDGAIGYIDSANIDPSVKTVLTIK